MDTEIIKINPKSIKLLEKNARYMDKEEFEQLVNNIKKDKTLTSVPFCYYNKNKEIEVLSGNHRVMASIEAGLEEIEIMISKTKLSTQQAIAIQLSHNSITGKDNSTLLAELYKELEDFDFKEYSGLTDEYIEECKKAELKLNLKGLQYQIYNLVFLPSEIKDIESTLSKIEDIFVKDKNVVLPICSHDNYLDAISEICQKYKIKNISTAFLKMIDIVKNAL